jgi:flagellar biosynthesis GTPase FlhF
MELQRILARDSRAANEKAIQLYGKDVLIISSQRLDNQIELIVAVDLDTTPEAPVAEPAKAALDKREEAAAPFVPFSKLFQSASAFAPLPPEESAPEVTQPLEAAVAAPQAIASTPALSQESQALQMYEGQRSQEIVELLRLEMAALRKEFSLSRQMMPWQDGLRLSPAIQQLSMAMSEVGMPAGLRALLTDSIQALESVEEAWPVMQSLLVGALNRPAMAPPESGVHALCGPSGSGKTSMVGRLAYAAAQVHGVENQVMISFADQRPGAWAQMQLLAAQSGVACFRAANSDMLRTLLQDVEGKTVWIDTCGTDFSAQAELLQAEHPKVLRHAVLPVDATVTSVQKILQSPALNWSSLMLSKVDEAAYPWALIKGLSEQSLGVSCMAGSTRMEQAAQSFDAARLVQLALTPLLQQVPAAPEVMATVPVLAVASKPSSAPVRASRAKKTVAAAPVKTVRQPVNRARINDLDDDILIPTLMGSLPMKPSRRKSANASSALKVAHG